MTMSALMVSAAARLVNKVITRLISFRRQRLYMGGPPLAPRHAPDQKPRRRVDRECDDEQNKPQLYERVAVDFRRRFGEFVSYRRGDRERRLEQRRGDLRPVAYDHRD